MLALLLSCSAAWRPDAPGRFDLDIPEGWQVTHNVRSFGNDHLILSRAASHATISLELIQADARSRRLPLDLLAELRALSTGRSLGVVSTRSHLHQIDVDGHEAWAVTGQRRWRLIRADFSTVVLRAGHSLVVLTLQTPEGALDRSGSAWSAVLTTLRFPQDPIPADLPAFDPEE